jgi:hypothetical protein
VRRCLYPYAGKSLYANHGQRVIVGQRLMQAASDVFLGWTRGRNGRDYYVRQLRDMKLSAVIEDRDTAMLRQYGRMCSHALARAHARSGDAAAAPARGPSLWAYDQVESWLARKSRVPSIVMNPRLDGSHAV